MPSFCALILPIPSEEVLIMNIVTIYSPEGCNLGSVGACPASPDASLGVLCSVQVYSFTGFRCDWLGNCVQQQDNKVASTPV